MGEVTELLLISGVDAEASLVLSSSGKFSDTIFEDTVHFHKGKLLLVSVSESVLNYQLSLR